MVDDELVFVELGEFDVCKRCPRCKDKDGDDERVVPRDSEPETLFQPGDSDCLISASSPKLVKSRGAT